MPTTKVNILWIIIFALPGVLLVTDFVFNAHFIASLAFKVKRKQAVIQAWKARKSVLLLSAQPTAILGTKLKLPRQRALGLEFEGFLGRSYLALGGRK